MRRLVMISCVFLTLSGGWLTAASEFLKVERSTTVAVLHIWAGFFFLVIFPMYSLDHIKVPREYGQFASDTAGTGGTYTDFVS